ncbi:MAG: 30S ribosomal protein S17 [bacterium]
MNNSEIKKRKLSGVVVSDKTDKTVVVLISRTKLHKKYHKKINEDKRYLAHDAENKCKLGDLVEIEESAPISKLKKWRISQILSSKEQSE